MIHGTGGLLRYSSWSWVVASRCVGRRAGRRLREAVGPRAGTEGTRLGRRRPRAPAIRPLSRSYKHATERTNILTSRSGWEACRLQLPEKPLLPHGSLERRGSRNLTCTMVHRKTNFVTFS